MLKVNKAANLVPWHCSNYQQSVHRYLNQLELLACSLPYLAHAHSAFWLIWLKPNIFFCIIMILGLWYNFKTTPIANYIQQQCQSLNTNILESPAIYYNREYSINYFKLAKWYRIGWLVLPEKLPQAIGLLLVVRVKFESCLFWKL